MHKLPETNKNIRFFSKRRNHFKHPAVMFRKITVEATGGYKEQFHLFEDYSLWIRMLQNSAVGYNIQEPILFMRTPSDLYIQRSRGYVTDMLRFHRWLVLIRWTPWIDYILGVRDHSKYVYYQIRYESWFIRICSEARLYNKQYCPVNLKFV